MQRLYLCIAILFLLNFNGTFGRTFDRCSLAKELNQLSVPRDQLATWVCIAQYESNFNSNAISAPDPNGSINYGLFQINSRWWCQGIAGESANGCNVSCAELATDDIAKAVTCARRIQSGQGWSAWAVYNSRCASNVPGVDECLV